VQLSTTLRAKPRAARILPTFTPGVGLLSAYQGDVDALTQSPVSAQRRHPANAVSTTAKCADTGPSADGNQRSWLRRKRSIGRHSLGAAFAPKAISRGRASARALS
jgi:hypothetical protein